MHRLHVGVVEEVEWPPRAEQLSRRLDVNDPARAMAQDILDDVLDRVRHLLDATEREDGLSLDAREIGMRGVGEIERVELHAVAKPEMRGDRPPGVQAILGNVEARQLLPAPAQRQGEQVMAVTAPELDESILIGGVRRDRIEQLR